MSLLLLIVLLLLVFGGLPTWGYHRKRSGSSPTPTSTSPPWSSPGARDEVLAPRPVG
jgi:Protein of unknown function (DUF3309)